MKLLHTADWHIGRQLNNNGISLLEDQAFVLDKIVSLAKQEAVDGVIIAGDLYDRSMPPVEAVALFDKILTRLLFDEGIPVYAITGNHDSAKRLKFGQEFFKRQDFYLVSDLADSFKPVELDQAQLFLLPYIDPIDARIYYQDDSIRDIHQAIQRIVADMVERFDPDKAHILVSHFAVAKGADDTSLREQMLSETTRTVGGLTSLTSDLFAAFDYVALGHIHTHHASPTDQVVYSGSPLIFNKDEAKRKDVKGVYLLEVADKQVSKRFVDLPAYKDFYVLTAPYKTLISKDFYEAYPRGQARFAFEIQVEDRKELEGLNFRAELEAIYGADIVDVRVLYPQTKRSAQSHKQAQGQPALAEDEQIEKFFQEMTGGQELTAYQKRLVKDILVEVKEG